MREQKILSILIVFSKTLTNSIKNGSLKFLCRNSLNSKNKGKTITFNNLMLTKDLFFLSKKNKLFKEWIKRNYLMKIKLKVIIKLQIIRMLYRMIRMKFKLNKMMLNAQQLFLKIQTKMDSCKMIIRYLKLKAQNFYQRVFLNWILCCWKMIMILIILKMKNCLKKNKLKSLPWEENNILKKITKKKEKLSFFYSMKKFRQF